VSSLTGLAQCEDLRVTLIQTATHWHDPVRNRDMFDNWFRHVPQKSQLVVLPEMFSTGFTMASSQVAEPMDGPTVEWMCARAAELNKVVCGSVVIEEDGAFYNRFLWVTPAGVEGIYDKRHRFRMAGEHQYYSAGAQRLVVELKGWRLCPLVCYDLRFPVWLRNRGDYDVLLCVANWPSVREVAWRALIQARAVENLAYMVAVNAVGTDGNDVRYSGGSAVFGPGGEVLVDCGRVEHLTSCTLKAGDLAAFRDGFPAWQDADEFQLK